MADLIRSIAPFWIWLALAFVFLVVEVLIAPVGFFLCLGTSAAVIAAVVFFLPNLSLLWSLTFFALALVCTGVGWWKLFRQDKGRVLKTGAENLLNLKNRQLIGHQTVLAEDMIAGRGRIRVNDSAWPTAADQNYPAGTRVKVTAVDGITLTIEAVE